MSTSPARPRTVRAESIMLKAGESFDLPGGAFAVTVELYDARYYVAWLMPAEEGSDAPDA